MRRKISRRVLFYATSTFIIVMMFSLLMFFTVFSMYREGTQTYDELAQHLIRPIHGVEAIPITTPEPLAEEPVEEEPEEPEEPEEEPEETFILPDHITLPQVDFDALHEINPNVVGWILLEGTQINYPVVQGTDNHHYLDHLFDGRRNAAGAIFVDSYNNPGFVDQNTVIYGHNMRDGSMFAALERYLTTGFFEENPWIFLLTPERNYVIKLFAGYQTNVGGNSWRLGFADDDDKQEWLNEGRDRSVFASDVEVNPAHRVVTLSTCSGPAQSGRFVAVGRLMPIA